MDISFHLRRTRWCSTIVPSTPYISFTGASPKYYATVRTTAAYRPVLDHHGLAELQPRADALARAQDWDGLTSLVPDELVHAARTLLMAFKFDPQVPNAAWRLNELAKHDQCDAHEPPLTRSFGPR